MTVQTAASGSPWLMLILSIPGRQPAVRVRVWRKLKGLGVGVLQDGVYVLPSRPALRELLNEQAQEVTSSGGSAQLLEVTVHGTGFERLFDRAAEYETLTQSVTSAARALKRVSRAQAARTAERLRRDFETIVARDFFPGSPQERARRALDHLRELTDRRLTPDEPHAAHRRIQRLDPADYQGRVWATRARPWVDRLASAWLIRRFIDQKAKIRWLKPPTGSSPRQLRPAVGFDFDGADFSHTDGKVTYEVILESFGLETDAALQRIGTIVHYLDVGGLPVPEAAGLEAVLRGMRDRLTDDDQLLADVSILLDDLYAQYRKQTAS